MKNSLEFTETVQQLIEAGRFIDAKGWVPATSGNFSARLSDNSIAITVSGKHKGQLVEDNIMLIDKEGNSLDGKKPSAETILHTSLYRRFPEVQAVLHPHSVNSTLISRLFQQKIILRDYELLKALQNIDTHEAEISIPIFTNDQNISRLAGLIDRFMDNQQSVHAYIIAGHGFYTWGKSVKDTLRHVEALEFIFDCEIRLYGAKHR